MGFNTIEINLEIQYLLKLYFNHEYQRTEEEREINHHGRPVKVSGEEDDETMDQHNQVESFYFMIIKNIFSRYHQCLLCQLMRLVLEDQSS